MKKTKIIISLILCLFLLSCANKNNNDSDIIEDNKKTAEDLYDQGMNLLSNRDYSEAIEIFNEIQGDYPFSKLAIKSLIMVGFAHYKDEEYDLAIETLNKFISLHPGNSEISYAYYLKALSYFEQISSIKKDQGMSESAKSAFEEVIARFPKTEYSQDSKLKLDVLNDRLAGKEIEIGRFYLNQNNHIAAINRFKNVIEKYETTSHTPEALFRLVEAYYSLGVKDEAIKYASVLGYNYPSSRWYKYSYDLIKNNFNETDKKNFFDKFILPQNDDSKK